MQLVEAERVEHEGARRARAARGGTPRARPRGRRRRRSSARRAGRAARCRELVEPPLEPLDHRGRRRPSAARTRAARARTGCARRRAPRARRPRPPRRAPPARPRRRRWWRCRPRVTSTSLAPASTAATISSPVPRVDAAHASRSPSATQREPARLGRLHHRAPVRQQREARPRTGRPSGSLTVRLAQLAAERATSASIVPSPPSPIGSSTASMPPARSPSRDRRATSARGERALEAVGATRTTPA